MDILVNFVIIGAMKSGTGSLARQLAKHPEICFSRVKEPGYFNSNLDWNASLEKYHKLFNPLNDQICGEASTMYTFLPEFQETHNKLFAYNPDMRLIYIMRQPVERVVSHYAHRLVRGTVKTPPEIAVFEDPAYINRSRYGVQIKPYLNLFKPKNVLLLIFEEYITDQKKILAQVANYLGISQEGFNGVDATPQHSSVGKWYLRRPFSNLVSLDSIHSLVSSIPVDLRKKFLPFLSRKLDRKPHFSPNLKDMLWSFLEDDICSIEAILGRTLTVWRQGYSD